MSGNCDENVLADTIENCLQFSEFLEGQKDSLIDILVDIEPYLSALDEIDRSINCLMNIRSQSEYIEKVQIGCGCSYLPLNQPLYAFTLNVFLLKLVSKKVYYRPPEKHREMHQKLYNLFDNFLSGIEICCISRNDFFVKHVQNSDVVIFTGKYENAVTLLNDLPPSTLLIYNGSALNPIIITPSANIPQSIIGTVNARLYNSGQDCMAPAGILVEESMTPIFVEGLIRELSRVKVGENRDHQVMVGPMISDLCAQENRELLKKYRTSIVFGGKEISTNLFVPTIFYFEHIQEEHQVITYAPFFFIHSYRNVQDIIEYFNTPVAQLYKGYVSIFGNMSEVNAVLKLGLNLVILRNTTLFDFEDGNLEFGGYGIGCSFVSVNNSITSRPILLLREVKNWFLTTKSDTLKQEIT